MPVGQYLFSLIVYAFKINTNGSFVAFFGDHYFLVLLLDVTLLGIYIYTVTFAPCFLVKYSMA